MENNFVAMTMPQRSITVILTIALLFLCLSGCEQKAWDQARKQRTVQGFKDYLQKYPHGKHAEYAWNRIERLSFIEAYRQKTPEAFRRFLQQFPGGKFRGPALRNIKKLYRAMADEVTIEQMTGARVTVETSMGPFTFALDPAKAPATCRNLLYLAWIGFYDGLTVTPVIDQKIVQMGDPLGTGLGGPGYMIPAEPNDLKHVRGAVSMFRLPMDPDSGGSQFFVCIRDLPEMDGHFTVFGHVVSGMDVLDAIAQVPTSGAQGRPPWRPLKTIYIKKVRVSDIELHWDRLNVTQEVPESDESREEQK